MSSSTRQATHKQRPTLTAHKSCATSVCTLLPPTPTAAAVCLYPLQSQCAVVRRNIPATRGLSRFHHPLRSCPSHQPCFPSWDQATISKWHRQIDRGFNAKGRGVRLESATRDTARPGGDCTNRGLPRSVRRGTRGWLRLVVA